MQTKKGQQNPDFPLSSRSQILIICLNPTCSSPTTRCLTSLTIRSHPSQCSSHYYTTDNITSLCWQNIIDYPNDHVGIAVNQKLKSVKNNRYQSVVQNVIGIFKDKVITVLQRFQKKFQQYLAPFSLQDTYLSLYSLDQFAKYLKQGSTPQFLNKILNKNLSKSKYQSLKQINQLLSIFQSNLENILLGFKNHLHQTIKQLSTNNLSSHQFFSLSNLPLNQPTSFTNPIQYGFIKSQFIASKKIESNQNTIIFPKIDNIASFLPWLYTDHGWNTGTHLLKITSLKFPSHPNAGLSVLPEHDIDTYPYNCFKSLFSKQGSGFHLVSAKDIQSDQTILFNDPQNRQKIQPSNLSEIQHTIGQVSQIILLLQLNAVKPRAIIKDICGTSIYICQLEEGQKYRMGIYGSGWKIVVNQLH